MRDRVAAKGIELAFGALVIFCTLVLRCSLMLADTGDPGAALSVPALRGARIAALVIRARDGEVLYERQPNEQLAPASNQKILTAVAALHAYGPAHRFTTTVLSDMAPDEQGRIRNIWIRGGGDPALTSEEWWRLSADLRRVGVRGIEGDIIVDDTVFDGQRWNAAWGSATARAYYPAVGGLMANYGSFTVEVRPGRRAGQPLSVAIDPPVSYLVVDNRGKTAADSKGTVLTVERVAGNGMERVIVSGTLGIDAAPFLAYRSVTEPALYAGSLFRLQLTANDIAVGGAVRAGTVPAGAQNLLAFQGKPLGEIVRLLMKFSNNGIAETLCKGLAVAAGRGQGSWPAGVAALRQYLESNGVDVSSFTLVDGSGLATSNRISPRGLVAALQRARESFAFGPELAAALPIAGVDGTLQQRAAGARTRVRAKTGLLSGALGLSGYAQLADGEDAIFSVLVNGYKSADADVMAAIDGFATALVNLRPSASSGGERPQ